MRYLAILLWAIAASADTRLFVVNGTTETPVADAYGVPTTAPGDSTDTRFRVRNSDGSTVTVPTLALSGFGFSFPSEPSLNSDASAADFRVRFAPAFAGSYSANLSVNGKGTILHGLAAPVVTLAPEGGAPLPTGTVIDFGNVQRGSQGLRGFRLDNPNPTAANVTVTVSGAAFTGPIGLTLPVPAGGSASFQILCRPQTTGTLTGAVTVDQRSFPLTVLAFDPAMPAPSLVVDPPTASSSQQVHLSVMLASASAVAGSGTVKLEFRSAVAGMADDPAVRFVSTGSRVASFQVKAGDSSGTFNGQPDIVFQTGTTAGSIVLTLQTTDTTKQASIAIGALPPAVATIAAVRRVNDVDVTVTGYDNTYSMSQLSFTFYDAKGAAIQAPLAADARAAFQSYFRGSTTGSSFLMLASFPVTGDATKIAAVEMSLTNSSGVTNVQRTSIP